MGTRKFLLSHMADVLKRRNNDNFDTSEPETLLPGEMKLYSYYRPGLVANDYIIEVEQDIAAPAVSDPQTQTLSVKNVRLDSNGKRIPSPQVFTVVVPRFTLDKAIVNSYYPSDGHQDEGRILPHIVFNDPHYPWEIPAGSPENKMYEPIDLGPVPVPLPGGGTEVRNVLRNLVPWIALLVFDVEELRFQKDEFDLMKSFKLEGYMTEADLSKQNLNGTFAMTVAQYAQNLPQDSRNDYSKEPSLDMDKISDKINVIFPSKKLIQRVIGQKFDGAARYDMQSHKYLAHVRNINTQDCPDATVNQTGTFSIVVSPRTGSVFGDASSRTPMTQPKTQVCHLVTIEHLDATIDTWGANPSGRVGLISLFSWIYTALPPNPINFVTTMRHLTESQQMLRIEEPKLKALEGAVKPSDVSMKAQVGRIIAARLRAGYTVSRWRTQTGEETAAFTRGPLVPISQPTGHPSALDLPDCSNTSQSYQILDTATGMMDLTYSAAWQAGKILAISDTNFSAALMRFRSRVYATISSQTLMRQNRVRPTRTLVTSLAASVKALNAVSSGPVADPSRFRPNNTNRSVTLLKDSVATGTLQSTTKSVVTYNTQAGDTVFNEFNKTGPNNSDWTIVHSWLADKLLLGGIPSQYLLPESSYLPRESLRFFYIDDFWLDCLIDGALSIANHLDGDDDIVRREMKKIFNQYLRNSIEDSGIKPQIPCYGFIMRSQLVKAMPDMKIEVTWQANPNIPKDERCAVCKWTKWDEQTLLALFDRPPEELQSITLKQPTHQQRFSLGYAIDVAPPSGSGNNVDVKFSPRQLYTINPPSEWMAINGQGHDYNSWYDVDSRTMKLSLMVSELNAMIQKPGAYDDHIPNSCEFGLELNDPVYFFDIKPPKNSPKPPAFIPRDRQLWVKESKPKPVPPSQPNPPISPPQQPQPQRPQTQSQPQPPIHTPPQPTIPLPIPTPIPIPTPPTRQPSIQPLPSTTTSTSPPTNTTSTQSRFNLLIFPSHHPPPRRHPNKYESTDNLPTQNTYFYDLIFDIRNKPLFARSSYDLLKITLDIPVYNPSSPGNVEALLEPNYDGPGVRMLSNQRFIPFLYHNAPGDPMHIELIPRAAEDGFALRLDDRRTRELGFRLAEVNVGPVRVWSEVEIVGERLRQRRGRVVVTMREYYKSGSVEGWDVVETRYVLIKWEGRDDEDIDDGLLP